MNSISIDEPDRVPPSSDTVGAIPNASETFLVEFVNPASIQRSIDRDARVTYIGTDSSNLQFLTRASSINDTSCHYASNRVPREHLSHEPERLPAEAIQLPDKAVVDGLLAAYFTHVNPGFPIVDELRFMTQYSARDPQSPPSLLLLQAILLVGAHVSPDAIAAARQALKATFFRRAKMLIDARFERNRDTVVQAALLLAWHTDGVEDVAANAWFWTRHAAAIALGLGMHRDAEPSTLVPHNKRMWRRVFWLLITWDVALALQSGRPQAIRLQDCDVRPLCANDFAECGEGTQVEFVAHAAGLAEIASEALSDRFGSRRTLEQRAQALRDADVALARWSQGLPEHLRLRPTLTMDMYASRLHLDYNTLLMLLHRPQPRRATDSTAELTREDADICSAAASHVQSLLEGLRARGLLAHMPSSVVHVCFTALIQLSVELRMMANPVLSTAAQRRYESVLESLRQVHEVWPQAGMVCYYFERSGRAGLPEVAERERTVTDDGMEQAAPLLGQAGAVAKSGELVPPRGSSRLHTPSTELQQDGVAHSAESRQDRVAVPLQENALPFFNDWNDMQSHYWDGLDLDSFNTGTDSML